MDFLLLGPVEIKNDDGTQVTFMRAKERHLLAFLLLQNGSSVSIDSVVDALWEDGPPPSWQATLHTYVSRLRSGFRSDVRITLKGASYQLDVDPERVDAGRFTSRVAQARTVVRAEEYRSAAKLFGQALAEWRGTPLDGISGLTVEHVRAHFEEDRRQAIYGYVDARFHLGQDPELITDLTTWAAEFRFDEGLAEQLMLALARTGRRVDAITQYETIRHRLNDELGVSPCSSLQDAHLRILRDEVPSIPQGPWTSHPAQPAQRRVGRPEKPLDPSVSPVAVFAQQLREMRIQAGSPTFRDLAAQTGLAATTLSKALSGVRLPTLEVTLVLVEALGGNEDEWRERQQHFARQQHQPEARAPRDQGAWPLPEVLRTPAEFVEQMRLLRAWAGKPSLRQLGRRGQVAPSTLCDVLRRDRLPRHAVLQAFLDGCGVPEDAQREWLAAWAALAAARSSTGTDLSA